MTGQAQGAARIAYAQETRVERAAGSSRRHAMGVVARCAFHLIPIGAAIHANFVRIGATVAIVVEELHLPGNLARRRPEIDICAEACGVLYPDRVVVRQVRSDYKNTELQVGSHGKDRRVMATVRASLYPGVPRA